MMICWLEGALNAQPALTFEYLTLTSLHFCDCADANDAATAVLLSLYLLTICLDALTIDN